MFRANVPIIRRKLQYLCDTGICHSVWVASGQVFRVRGPKSFVGDEKAKPVVWQNDYMEIALIACREELKGRTEIESHMVIASWKGLNSLCRYKRVFL